MTSPTTAQFVQLVSAREINTRLRTKGFAIGTALMLVAIAGYIALVHLISGGSATVGLTPPVASLAPPLHSVASAAGTKIDTVAVADTSAGESKVRAGDLDALVVGSPDDFTVVVKRQLSSDLRTVFTLLTRQQALNRQVVALGGDPAQVDATVAAATANTVALQSGGSQHTQRLVLGVTAGGLIYIALLLYGQGVAQSVVEEKSSRVVELLLSTLRPYQLMAGKVLGIGTVGLLQFLILGVAGLAAGLASGVLTIDVGAAAGMLVWAVVWYLLGFFLYALLFAAGGALVSRQEDIGAVVSPLLLLIIIPFVIGVSTVPTNPDSTLVAVLSLVPLFAPMIMPMRLGAGSASGLEAAVAVALTVVLLVVLVRLTGRIYANAVLRTGARTRLRDALRPA
ncbi:MAG: ABC transporter permease [Frankiaceae bacterium]